MTSPLPSNPANWPTDPYQLLGVGQDADLREIRRAYARLTKLYRPDHSPQEFQLVRAAYDRVCAWQEFRSQFPPDEVDEREQTPHTDTETPVPEADARADTPSSLDPSPVTSRPRITAPRDSLTDGLDAVRQLIHDGEFAACHDKLIQLDRDYPGNEDVRLRLCWLRTLFPELSPEHDPVTFLAGDSMETLTPRTWRVLLRFLELNPEAVLSPRVDSWLQRPIPQYPLTQVLELRWKRAARISQFAKIMDDLEQLQNRLTRIGTGHWLSVVVLAMRITRWFPHEDVEQLWDGAHEEFRSQEGESLSFSRLFDEHEWLLEVRENIQTNYWSAWKCPRNVSMIGQEQAEAWMSVLRTTSVACDAEWRRELEALLGPWVASPEAALKSAEELCFRFPALASVVHHFLQSIPLRHVRSPHLVARAEQCLNYIQRPSNEPSIDSMVTRSAKLKVLTFCVDEAVDLRELIRLLSGSHVKLYKFIYEDPALDLAILASRRFWELPTAELGQGS